MKSSFFLGSLLLTSGFLFAQKGMVREKIDPQFLRIMDSTRLAAPKTEKGCNANKQVKTTKKSPQKYACIVYTKNAGALREKGITVNSVLPTFVTAVATVEEISRMSRMDAVTYIEFPANDRPQL